MYRLNKYFVTVFLLLVFTQGISMRLWMHHWFHETAVSKSSVPSSAEIKINCDCFQDANIPLQNVPSFELVMPADNYFTEYSVFNIFFSSRDKIFCSLKGPPQT